MKGHQLPRVGSWAEREPVFQEVEQAVSAEALAQWEWEVSEEPVALKVVTAAREVREVWAGLGLREQLCRRHAGLTRLPDRQKDGRPD